MSVVRSPSTWKSGKKYHGLGSSFLGSRELGARRTVPRASMVYWPATRQRPLLSHYIMVHDVLHTSHYYFCASAFGNHQHHQPWTMGRLDPSPKSTMRSIFPPRSSNRSPSVNDNLRSCLISTTRSEK